jgi:hypothetical protein
VRLLASAVTNILAPHRATAGALPPRQLTAVPASEAVRCSNSGCLASNPADAKFCRRCGHGLPAATRVQVRRAAVW